MVRKAGDGRDCAEALGEVNEGREGRWGRDSMEVGPWDSCFFISTGKNFYMGASNQMSGLYAWKSCLLLTEPFPLVFRRLEHESHIRVSFNSFFQEQLGTDEVFRGVYCKVKQGC